MNVPLSKIHSALNLVLLELGSDALYRPGLSDSIKLLTSLAEEYRKLREHNAFQDTIIAEQQNVIEELKGKLSATTLSIDDEPETKAPRKKR